MIMAIMTPLRLRATVHVCIYIIFFSSLLLFTTTLAAQPDDDDEPLLPPGADERTPVAESGADADAATLYYEAVSLGNQRQLKAARGKLTELVSRFPQHPMANRARLQLAQLMIGNRETDGALKLLEELAKGPAGNADTRESRLAASAAGGRP